MEKEAYRAWYRKWRPLTFDDVCGQEQVTDILKYQVANQRTSHAYLFCGSRGTGKTSCAKILARAVNCEHPQNGNPCNACAACKSILAGLSTDVIEIDAASNNSVDNVRDLKEEIHFTPAELKYRVYIIDEVHMMSGSAFNALLKTLEEPPPYVLFILATTEMQKLPSTIISRCQRYDFRRLPSGVLVQRMQTIAKAEGVELEESGALVIARMAQGGMRDSVSLLELCAGAKKKIDYDLAVSLLGGGSRETVLALIQAISAKDYDRIFSIIAEIVMASRDLAVFWQELMDGYRDLMVVKASSKAKEYLDITDGEAERLREVAALFSMETLIAHSRMLEDALLKMQRSGGAKRACAEVALIKMCDPRYSATPEALQERVAKLEEEVALLRLGIPTGAATAAPTPPPAKAEEPPKSAEQAATPKPAPPKDSGEGTYTALPYWAEIVADLSAQKGAVAGFLQQAKAYRTPEGGFLLKVPSDFCGKMISRPEVLTLIKNRISTYEGQNITALPFDVKNEKAVAQGNFVDEVVRAIES